MEDYKPTLETEESKKSTSMIEGFDCKGDLAFVAECDEDGNPLIVAEAHLNLETGLAHAEVRGLTKVHRFDMIDPNTGEVNSSIKSAGNLAKQAISAAVLSDNFNSSSESKDEIILRR